MTRSWPSTRAGNTFVVVLLVVFSANISVQFVRPDDTNGGTADPVDVIPGLGVNWGRMASHPLPPDSVVQMLKDNGIKRVKLFEADEDSVLALANTGIEVMVAIPNNMLLYLSDSYDHAVDWVRENVIPNIEEGVDIRYVAVGNEPFLESYNNSFTNITFPVLQSIQRALESEGHGGKVKATVPLNADVYDGDKPSHGQFRKDINSLMTQIVNFLHQKDSPFVVNIYPFLSLYQNPNFPFGYAFFDNHDTRHITDGNLTYENVFDANYDTLVWALVKAGVPDLKILVGEVGWPTDGHYYANPTLANKFYDGLLKKLASKKGTPIRPGIQLEVYLFSLIDEDAKSILPGNFERHWGLFLYDGKPKFPIDLSGKGNDKMLKGATGVEYLPSKWCVMNPDVDNLTKAALEVDYECTLSDCTSLGYGSSCNGLDLRGNISYAFNMYFQVQNQDVEACDFDGMATIVSQNASQGSCLFPVQIISAAAGDRRVVAWGWLLLYAFGFGMMCV